MTTHVFVVDQTTFRYHLEYLFVGTGSKENSIDFNNNADSLLHPSTERKLTSMLADGCRIRKNDFILFYVQASTHHEGAFYGIFQAAYDYVFIENHSSNQQYLYDLLGKSLPIRTMIKPFEVYAQGVTEWEALDEIKYLSSPCQLLWSLIYRKLKGNRGNTMITTYEAERLFELIKRHNKRKKLNFSSDNSLSFDNDTRTICINSRPFSRYIGEKEEVRILPRLINKYNNCRPHEVQLQVFITQNIGRGTNKSLDKAILDDNSIIDWIGNEVACGVGMQRMDILLSTNDPIGTSIYPIELKCTELAPDYFKQLLRYINWLEQYYCPNKPSGIRPVLIFRKAQSDYSIKSDIFDAILDFNKRAMLAGIQRYEDIVLVQYSITDNDIVFERVNY